MKLTKKELDCIRFYMGDPDVANRGDFLGGVKAYNTINALLHEDIVNEQDKIADGKPIEVLNQNHVKQMIDLIQTIDQAMEKTTHSNCPLITYRVDRMSEIEAIEKRKRIEGFYSTCKYGFLKEYANTKQNVVLMEIEREPDVPFLDFEELFQKEYAKKEEAELLLPFDCEVKHLRKLTCTDEENDLYRDLHGNVPCGKYRLLVGRRCTLQHRENRYSIDELTAEDTVSRIRHFLQEMTKGHAVDEIEKQFYENWKMKLKHFIENAG